MRYLLLVLVAGLMIGACNDCSEHCYSLIVLPGKDSNRHPLGPEVLPGVYKHEVKGRYLIYWQCMIYSNGAVIGPSYGKVPHVVDMGTDGKAEMVCVGEPE